MGNNFNGKLKIGNENEYLTPTLMDDFNGKTITHIDIGYQFVVIAIQINSTLFVKVQHHKKKQTYQDIIIICNK